MWAAFSNEQLSIFSNQQHSPIIIEGSGIYSAISLRSYIHLISASCTLSTSAQNRPGQASSGQSTQNLGDWRQRLPSEGRLLDMVRQRFELAASHQHLNHGPIGGQQKIYLSQSLTFSGIELPSKPANEVSDL